MDKVRFGRALGYGARHAAKSLAQAVDAATTPSPGTPTAPASRPASQRLSAPTVRQATMHARHTAKSVWSPLARFSNVLWLQVTGTFFLVIAAFLSQGLWKTRSAISLPLHSHDAEKFYLHAVAFAIFAYFAGSNFIRAYRRERR